MNIKIGQEYKQIKELNGFPYNRTGEIWVVNEMNENYIILKNGVLGLGVSKEELINHFELLDNENTRNKVEYIENLDSKEKVKVIRNDMATIVILPDGSKGVSKCLPEDVYDAEKGYQIAYIKAKIKSLKKQLKKLSK